MTGCRSAMRSKMLLLFIAFLRNLNVVQLLKAKCLRIISLVPVVYTDDRGRIIFDIDILGIRRSSTRSPYTLIPAIDMINVFIDLPPFTSPVSPVDSDIILHLYYLVNTF